MIAVAELPMPAATEEALVASVCRESFSCFVREFWACVPGAGKLIWNWHLDLICDEMQAAAERVFAGRPREYDLIFNVPFGTSKSTVVSILFPAWAWTRMPHARFLTGTHTDKLVRDLSAKSRTVITSEKYRACFPGIGLVKDSEDYFRNNHGGDRNCCTVGGVTPTGFHADFILIDDPIDPQGARSQVELDTAAYFCREVIPSRKTDKAVSLTVLIMQRLDYRDPTAVLEEVGRRDGSVPVRRISLPGELTDRVNPPLEWLRERYGDCVYGEDGLLDPERLSRPVLGTYRATLGLSGYSAQVLQDPRPPGGAMFRPQWFSQRAKAAPYHARRVRYVDRAATQGGGCATAMVLMARGDDGRLYVEHVERGQWEPNERNDRIVATAQRDKDRYGPRNAPVCVIEAERGSTGLESFQGIARRLMDIGVRVREDMPTGSKDSRAEPWADQLAAMNVWLVEDGTWDVAGYVEEHLLFKPEPGKRVGGFKDRVDASSGCRGILCGKRPAASRLRIVPLARQAGFRGPRLVVCGGDELSLAVTELPALLVRFVDPEPYNRVEGGAGGHGAAGEPPTELHPFSHETPAGPLLGHGLCNLLGEVTLAFADLDPADRQGTWDEGVSSQLAKAEHAKRMWGLVARRREPPAEAVVFADSGGGDGRALSAALAVADVLRLPRGKAVCFPGEPERFVGEKDKAPNAHVYEVLKRGRELVI